MPTSRSRGRYQPEGDNTEAQQLADRCRAAAKEAGYTRRSIEDAVGPLVDHMAAAIEEVNDAEIARQSAKDD
jgi:hypothetical protein